MALDERQHGGGVLKPTLWRTCRALANRIRLRMLQHIFKHPGQTVSEIAEAMDLPVSMASHYLRVLNARGLLGVKRHARYARYVAVADPAVVGMRKLVMALRDSLSKGSERERVVVFRILTAFTHPRRLAILGILRKYPGATAEELKWRVRIPDRSLRRHLKKLAARHFVVKKGDRLYLRVPRHALARALLRYEL